VNKNEAIKTLRDYLTTGWRNGTAPESTDALAALDSLAVEPIAIVKSGTCGCTSCPMYPSIPLDVNSKDLDPEIKAAVQENFWELAGKPKVVEPSEEENYGSK